MSEPWGNLFQGQREIRSVSVLGFASFHFLFLATTPGAGGGAEGARRGCPGWPLRTPPGGEKLKSSGHLSPVPAHLGFSRCFLVCTGSATGRGWGWKGKVLLARVAQLARPWLSTSLPASGFWTWGSALCSISWKLGPLQGAADRGRPQCGWEILALRPRKGNAVPPTWSDPVKDAGQERCRNLETQSAGWAWRSPQPRGTALWIPINAVSLPFLDPKTCCPPFSDAGHESGNFSRSLPGPLLSPSEIQS